MKSVMLSIQPKWCELIANGKKTIEVRKTRPKLEPPFKCYIYCTNSKGLNDVIMSGDRCYVLNGYVIGEFVCDRIEEFKITDVGVQFKRFSALYETCLKVKGMHEYANGKTVVYGWHISDLKIYDEPKELSEFVKPCIKMDDNTYIVDNLCGSCKKAVFGGCDGKLLGCDDKITRPPQSWCYVEAQG